MMDSSLIRRNFIDFFVEKGHVLVPSASLIPEDTSVLLTTAGMQPFKRYFLGEPSPWGARVASCQKCFRTSDIDQVGDATHLTFLEMLGNFSFGDYFKAEAAAWALELLTENYQLAPSRMRFTYFGGEDGLPADTEAADIWRELKVDPDSILPFGRADNFWGPTGRSGPCGPTSEIHYDLTGQPCRRGSQCIPGCECGRFVEIWNLVFNQYYQDEKGELSDLPQRGIDTGMGLERLTAAVQGKSSIFETDLLEPLLDLFGRADLTARRILADHTRGIIFLTAERIEPGNVERGYVMRRLIRRLLEISSREGISGECLNDALVWAEGKYQEIYPELEGAAGRAQETIARERARLEKAVKQGLSQLEEGQAIDGREAFRLYSTYGLSPDELRRRGYLFDEQELAAAIEEHRSISRQGAEKKFGGHGTDQADTPAEKDRKIRLHTATHLLQAALREVLGGQVRQKGSDITADRLRFDFSFDRPLEDRELSAVAELINRQIESGGRVERTEMDFSEALEKGALIVEGQPYPEKVDVYAIIKADGSVFSREVCGGPHVSDIGDLGRFRIIKEQSSSAGIRRIKATLEDE